MKTESLTPRPEVGIELQKRIGQGWQAIGFRQVMIDLTTDCGLYACRHISQFQQQNRR